jgi:hypothetical protein
LHSRFGSTASPETNRTASLCRDIFRVLLSKRR